MEHLERQINTLSAPLWPVLIGLIAGIAVGIATGMSPWWCVAVLAVAVLCLAFRKWIPAILLAALAVGWVDVSFWQSRSFPESMNGVEAYYGGEVTDVSEGESSRRVSMVVNRCGADSAVMPECRRFAAIVFVGSMLPPIATGDQICVRASMSVPEFDPDLPYEIDYARYYAERGIEATAFVSSADVSVCGYGRGFRNDLRRLRDRLSQLLLRSGLGSETALFVNAVLLGDTSLISEKVRSDFATSGMAHLLALSGMHVAIIAMIMGLALFPLRAFRLNGLRLVITIVLLWLYAMLTGMSPSVVRAVIMATLVLAGLMLRRRSYPLNNLCMAAVAILLFDPMALVSPGFQLSFVAVASILVISPVINPVDRRRHPLLYGLVSWVAVCVAAVLGTGMLAAYYFHSYPLYFLLGNLVAVLVMPLLMGVSVLLIGCESLGFDPIWLCRIADMLYELISGVAGSVSHTPGTAIKDLYFPAWILSAYYATVVMVYMAVVRRRAIYVCGIVCGIVVTAACLYMTVPALPQSEYFITRNAYRTDIIVRDGSDAWLITTASKSDTAGIAAECMERYGEYFGRAGVMRLRPVDCDGFLTLGVDSYVVLKRGSEVPGLSRKVRYALVCRGYLGDVATLAAVADTVLLSRDIDIRRHDRYVAELQRESVPYRSLRDGGIHRVLHQDAVRMSYPFRK